MKGIIILTLIYLVGCVPTVPLEQLETQALVTGDWTAVEQRERVIARRKARAGIDCPAGLIGYCETFASQRRCTCISSKTSRSIFAQF